jgi:hypothetical protein
MARGPGTFRRQDVIRLLRAVKAAGCPVDRVEILDRSGNKIVAVVGSGDHTVGVGSDNEWDTPAGETRQ